MLMVPSSSSSTFQCHPSEGVDLVIMRCCKIPACPKMALWFHDIRVRVGSLTAAHHNYLGVRCVPKIAAWVALISVRYGESKRIGLMNQRR